MTPELEDRRAGLSAALETAIRDGQLAAAYRVIDGLTRPFARDVMLFAGLTVHLAKGREFWTLAQAEIQQACGRREPRRPR